MAVLVAQGLLEAVGERKGRFYVAAEVLRAISAKTREKKVHPDPFKDDMENEPFLPGFDKFVGE